MLDAFGKTRRFHAICTRCCAYPVSFLYEPISLVPCGNRTQRPVAVSKTFSRSCARIGPGRSALQPLIRRAGMELPAVIKYGDSARCSWAVALTDDWYGFVFVRPSVPPVCCAVCDGICSVCPLWNASINGGAESAFMYSSLLHSVNLLGGCGMGGGVEVWGMISAGGG